MHQRRASSASRAKAVDLRHRRRRPRLRQLHQRARSTPATAWRWRYRAGVPLKDMEFVQFHPTGLLGTNILITEGARGEGGVPAQQRRRAVHGDATRHKVMELAPRDVVSRADADRDQRGPRRRRTRTSSSTCATWAPRRSCERLPQIRELAIDFAGVDPIDEPIPIQPGQHYSMGGIDVDTDGATPHAGPLRGRRVRLRAACTAPTAWAATRCWRPSSSAAVRRGRGAVPRRPGSEETAERTHRGRGASGHGGQGERPGQRHGHRGRL